MGKSFIFFLEQLWDSPGSLQTRGRGRLPGPMDGHGDQLSEHPWVSAEFRQQMVIWSTWGCLFLELTELAVCPLRYCIQAWQTKETCVHLCLPGPLAGEWGGNEAARVKFSSQGLECRQWGQLGPTWCSSDFVRARDIRFLNNMGTSASAKALRPITCSLRHREGQERDLHAAVKF